MQHLSEEQKRELCSLFAKINDESGWAYRYLKADSTSLLRESVEQLTTLTDQLSSALKEIKLKKAA
jgi:hypothetical protein